MRKKTKEFTPGGVAALVLGAVCLSWGLNHLVPIWSAVRFLFGLIFPFLLGCALAFLLNIPMRFMERLLRRIPVKRRGWIRPAALIVTLLLVIGVVGGVVWIVVPQLGETIASIRSQLPSFLRSVQTWLTALSAQYPELGDLAEWLMNSIDPSSAGLLSKVTDFLSNALAGFFSSSLSMATSAFSGVVNFFVALVFALYALAGKESLLGQVRHLMRAFLPEGWNRRIHSVATLVDKVFSSFFTGQCVEACILGTLFFLAMSLFGLPYAVLVSVLVGFTALIPVFGAFIGCVVGALLILVQNPMQALGFVILFLVLQQIEGNLIYPRVVGSSVGLPAIWVLLAVTLGGSMFGVAGMLLFIPGVSVLYTLLRQEVHRRLAAKAVATSNVSREASARERPGEAESQQENR